MVHTANYRGCVNFLKLHQKRSYAQPAAPRRQASGGPVEEKIPTTPQQQVSFGLTLEDINLLKDLVEELQLKKIVSAYRACLNEVKTASSPLEKLMIMLQAI